jgi:opacity protein-like surface antigen
MKRYVCVAVWALAGLLCIGVPVQAQTTAASDSRLTAEILAGPTLGHKSDSFVAGEVTWRLRPMLDIYVEGGHIGNVATKEMDANAALIANALGLQVASTSIKVNHFDAGIKYHVTPHGNLHPYFLAGVGFAHVNFDTTFAANGTVVDPGIPLGGDLAGSSNQAMVLFGGGLTFPIQNRYFADVGYRFGLIFSKVSDVENDVAIGTQRVTFGFGVRF